MPEYKYRGMLRNGKILRGVMNAKNRHEVIVKFGTGRVLMKPAAPGTGVIAGGPVRSIVEVAGIKDIRTKALRSNNPFNVVRATMDGLLSLRTAEQVAAVRGKSESEIKELRIKNGIVANFKWLIHVVLNLKLKHHIIIQVMMMETKLNNLIKRK